MGKKEVQRAGGAVSSGERKKAVAPVPEKEDAAGKRQIGMAACPVFRPTEEEFKDFAKFVASIEPQVLAFGACRVVPPASWKARESPYDDSPEVENLVIKAPVRQEAIGGRGIFMLTNMELKPMTVKQYKEMAAKADNCPPDTSGGRAGGRGSEEGDEYTALEKRYWQGFVAKAPVYGSDNHSQTLMEDSAGEWNLSKLPTMLRSRIKAKLPGVNSPYLYMGMWRAMFAWHVEDMDLYSINFLHWGAPKLWYAVPASHSPALERLSASLHPGQHRECPQFLRHKASVIAPHHLHAAKIPVTRVVQQPGEFVITMPYAYHSGFNLGLNCAEAVNFGSDRWLPYGQKAKPCLCFPDVVNISMRIFGDDAAEGRVTDVDPDATIDEILCQGCGQGKDEDVIVLCDGCTGGYHLECAKPSLESVPKGRWLCEACRAHEAKEGLATAHGHEVDKVKKAKCTACGVGGHDVALMERHEELFKAWMADVELPPPKEGKFMVCEECSDHAREASNAVIDDGQFEVCLWCMGRSAGREGSEELLCCSKCPRVLCKACLQLSMGRDAVAKAVKDDEWACPVCCPSSLASRKDKATMQAALDAAHKQVSSLGLSMQEVVGLISSLRTVGGDAAGVHGQAVAKLKKSQRGGLWAQLGLGAEAPEVGNRKGRGGGCHFCSKPGQRVLFECGVEGCSHRFCDACLEAVFTSQWDFLVAAAARVVRPDRKGASKGEWPYSRPVWQKGVDTGLRPCGELSVGDIIECEDVGGFYAAKIMETRGAQVKVHFTGWKARFDHWVPRASPRLCDARKNAPELQIEKYSKGGGKVRPVPAHVMRGIKLFAKGLKREGHAPTSPAKRKVPAGERGGAEREKKEPKTQMPPPRAGERQSARCRRGQEKEGKKADEAQEADGPEGKQEGKEDRALSGTPMEDVHGVQRVAGEEDELSVGGLEKESGGEGETGEKEEADEEGEAGVKDEAGQREGQGGVDKDGGGSGMVEMGIIQGGAEGGGAEGGACEVFSRGGLCTWAVHVGCARGKEVHEAGRGGAEAAAVSAGQTKASMPDCKQERFQEKGGGGMDVELAGLESGREAEGGGGWAGADCSVAAQGGAPHAPATPKARCDVKAGHDGKAGSEAKAGDVEMTVCETKAGNEAWDSAASAPVKREAGASKEPSAAMVESMPSFTCPVCSLECSCAMLDPEGFEPCAKLRLKMKSLIKGKTSKRPGKRGGKAAGDMQGEAKKAKPGEDVAAAEALAEAKAKDVKAADPIQTEGKGDAECAPEDKMEDAQAEDKIEDG